MCGLFESESRRIAACRYIAIDRAPHQQSNGIVQSLPDDNFYHARAPCAPDNLRIILASVCMRHSFTSGSNTLVYGPNRPSNKRYRTIT